MKILFGVLVLVFTIVSHNCFAASLPENCVRGSLSESAGAEARFASGKVIDGSLVCRADNSVIKVIFTSSDECCFQRAADGTCYHPNPACEGCVCYHRGADGTCYHCSCAQGCP